MSNVSKLRRVKAFLNTEIKKHFSKRSVVSTIANLTKKRKKEQNGE